MDDIGQNLSVDTGGGSNLLNDSSSEDVENYYFIERPIFDKIDLYVTPIWYIIGVPGNVLAFVVWIQRRMRPSSGYFLAALALDECVFLVMQVSRCKGEKLMCRSLVDSIPIWIN